MSSMLCCCEFLPEVCGERVVVDTDEISFRDRLKITPSSTFTAQVHASFIKNNLFLKRYSFSEEQLTKWLVAQTADSASVNLKTARLLLILHIAN